jgi:uncharacterized membrane protein YcjF (UPF0283 family)
MMKRMKTYLTLVAAGLAIFFSLVLFNQFAQLYHSAAEIHPYFGFFVLACLLIILGVCIIYPVVQLLRLPKVILPPADENSPEYHRYRQQLCATLMKNPHLAEERIDFTDQDAGLQAALVSLNNKADAILKERARSVCVTTAISHYGRLDALLVLIAQVRMIWQISHLYKTRPHWKETIRLFANVVATVFIAGSIEDINIDSQVELLVKSALGSSISSMPGVGGASSFFVRSILSGATNAFLTLRVGIITRRYCSALTALDRKSVRRTALAEAGKLLGTIVLETTSQVAEAIGKGIIRAGKDRVVSGAKFAQQTVKAGADAVVGGVTTGAIKTSKVVVDTAEVTADAFASGAKQTYDAAATGSEQVGKVLVEAGKEVAKAGAGVKDALLKAFAKKK